MELKKGKFVRFYSNEKKNLELPWEKNDGKKRSIEFSLPVFKMGKKLENESKIMNSDSSGRSKGFLESNGLQEEKNKRILNPESERILRWNRVFLFSCLTALFVDPLFFYLPSVIHHKRSSCMTTDFNLGIVVTVFRTFADVFYLLHMILKFRIAYVSPTSRVFGKGELVTDPKKIAKRYLKSDFCIDLIASLPLPQILGAAWYLLSVERHAMCWKSACRSEFSPMKCRLDYLDCGTLNDVDRRIWEVNTTVFSQCSPDEDVVFNYGIFANAIAKDVVSSRFLQKYFYCLWWGLQNLSSYGQGLSTSIYMGETLFAILIAIMGLVLFAHLIGNMQTYLQSITVRLEEWRVKRRDTEEWMKHRQLPQDLQERVRRFVQYKWLATRGVDEESILQGLPTDLRRDIQRHLCLDLVRRVPFFAQMDDQLLDAICERLASSLCTQRTYIVREGDPVTEMLFIIRGMLESSTTDGGRSGFFNSITLRPGDFCGEELLAWALLPKSSISLPSSTRTVKAITEVEAFALRAEDLKFVANQFRRLHSKKLQHTFRFYSYHWRTWAACFIQAAWRRFKRRIIAKSLSLQESFSMTPEKPVADEAEQEEEEHNTPRSNYSQAKQNLGVTILASRFAANTRRGAQKLKDVNLSKLRKPDEPDFSEEPDD